MGLGFYVLILFVVKKADFDKLRPIFFAFISNIFDIMAIFINKVVTMS